MRPYGYAASRDPWSDAAVRRFIRDTYLARGDRSLPNVDMLLRLARADITGSAPRRRRIAEESWRSLKEQGGRGKGRGRRREAGEPLERQRPHGAVRPGARALDQDPQRLPAERGGRRTPRQGRQRRPASWPKPTPASTTSSRSNEENLDPLVTTDWLADTSRRRRTLRVVDIRGYVNKTDLGGGRQKAEYLAAREEYDEAHIPGAVYVDWTSDITDPDDPVPAQVAPPERFAELMGSLGIGDDTHVVVYDHAGGQFATRLWWALTYYGHDRVSVLDGGWKKWTAEGRPTTAEVPEPEPAVFTPRPRAAGGRTPKALLAASEGGRRFRPRRARRGAVHRRRGAGRGQGGARAWGRPPPRRQPLRPRERYLPLRRGAGAEAAGGRCARGQRRARRRLLQRRGRRHGPALRVAPARLQESWPTTTARGTNGAQGGPARRALNAGLERRPGNQRAGSELRC